MKIEIEENEEEKKEGVDVKMARKRSLIKRRVRRKTG